MHESKESLWVLVISPALWAIHFLLCYVTAAVWCAKHGSAASLMPVRTAFGAYTVVALAGIAWVAWIGHTRERLPAGGGAEGLRAAPRKGEAHAFGSAATADPAAADAAYARGDGRVPHDADSDEDRHRFLGRATLLLSLLSAVGVVFSGLVGVFIWDCH